MEIKLLIDLKKQTFSLAIVVTMEMYNVESLYQTAEYFQCENFLICSIINSILQLVCTMFCMSVGFQLLHK